MLCELKRSFLSSVKHLLSSTMFLCVWHHIQQVVHQDYHCLSELCFLTSGLFYLNFHRLRLISLCCSSVFPLSLKHSILAPVSLSPLLNTLLWLVSSHKPEPELWKATEQLCQINSYMPNKLLGINCASLRCFGSSVSMKEKRFCWCRLWPF